MKLGYNTNGLAHHDPIQALEMLAEIGYRSVAITIDHHWLAPDSPTQQIQLAEISKTLKHCQLDCVIESGARFLLDPRRKHWPTLLAEDSAHSTLRIDFIKYCIDIAGQLGGGVVSIWSGAKPSTMDDQQALDTLAKNLEVVVQYAEHAEVDIGFEPEPGMFIDTTTGFSRLLSWIDSPRLNMTLDIGHLFCLGEVPIVDFVRRWSDRLVNVHIEDMIAGEHNHLMLGDGHMHFPPIIESLIEIGYDQGLHVELSRHSHDAANVARDSFEFLDGIIREIKAKQSK